MIEAGLLTKAAIATRLLIELGMIGKSDSDRTRVGVPTKLAKLAAAGTYEGATSFGFRDRRRACADSFKASGFYFDRLGDKDARTVTDAPNNGSLS